MLRNRMLMETLEDVVAERLIPVEDPTRVLGVMRSAELVVHANGLRACLQPGARRCPRLRWRDLLVLCRGPSSPAPAGSGAVVRSWG
jgi:hypothetical protein